jgi:hypothetical protein
MLDKDTGQDKRATESHLFIGTDRVVQDRMRKTLKWKDMGMALVTK